jgi:NADH-quinone oxidoreductase subunit G
LLQSFHAVVKPLAETRPAWKVLRVLANMLGLPGFDFESSQAVLLHASRGVVGNIPSGVLNNTTSAQIDISDVQDTPNTASIYQLDSIVRRATSLQLTADAQNVVLINATEVSA